MLPRMPRNVAKRILEACRKGEAVVVVPGSRKPHLPSRVFRFEKYLKMKELPRKVRPWTARGARKSHPDPLGAVEGKVLEPIRRKNLYDET